MQRYGAYKDSGVEWIGEIPAGWEVVNLSALATQRKRKNIGSIEGNVLSLSYGRIKRRIIDNSGLLPESFETYNVIEPGDIVLRLTDLQNDQVSLRVGRSDERGIITSAYCTLNPNNVDSRYLFDILACFDYQKGFYGLAGGVRQGLTFDGIKGLKFPLPSIREQQAIADYLDEKTAEIDSIVSQTERSIGLLREYRKSVISEVVTKGLNPNAPMKDSGVEWIGEIPEGWEVSKFRWVLKKVSRDPLPDDEVVTCFRDGEVTLRTNRRTDGFTMSDKEIGYQHICKGDFVIHGMDGFAGAMGISDSDGKASPVLMAFNARGAEDLRYMNYLLRFYAWQDVFLSLSTTIRVRSCDLNWGKVAPIPVILPFPREQAAIADYLDAKTAEIDSLIADKQRQVELLREYRKSLISEAVTGKFKVPGLE
ncbi:MAG: restriction endonuclease subunit S [Coriobacteriaceae bacterium]|nr:restriction endonuclease subunit S [Coriobacteriaceae bacterium]